MRIEDLTVPGVWRCPKCQFTQVNQTLAPDGIGADTRPHLWPCPNDGRDMVPVTWREYAADLEKMLTEKIEEVAVLQSQYTAQVTVAKIFNRDCDDAVRLLQWFIRQFQGDTGTGESYWEQFEEYRIARMMVRRMESEVGK